MCGIGGVIAYREGAPRVRQSELQAIQAAMASRGPDGEGCWISAGRDAGLVHRRLAIIDLSTDAAQPMASSDSRFQVVFNGEIYNFRELRESLQREGCVFRTQSDTEVLLQMYARHGEGMVEHLRGMFAFAIWDSLRGVAFLVRDPFGIKPLYYADDGGCLRFASQVKALLQLSSVDREPDAAGHVGFLTMGSVPEPFTLYRSIKSLPAGCSLTVAPGTEPRIARHFDVAAEYASAPPSGPSSDRPEALGDALSRAIRRHLVADVPVGIFLSAGLDSAMIASIASRVSPTRLQSVTLGFHEYRGTDRDEAPAAERLAAQLGLDHQTIWITQREFDADLANIFDAMDQPSIDGVNTYFVSKVAAARGLKVALSGLGGDELFGGYPSFREVPRLARFLRPMRRARWLGTFARIVGEPVVRAFASPKAAGLLEYGGSLAGAYLLRRALYMPWEVERLLDPQFFKEGWQRLGLLGAMEESVGRLEGRSAISSLEFCWYLRNQLLRDTDWAGMAHGLEIRVPLLDLDLFRTVTGMNRQHAVTKAEAARAVGVPLGADVLTRPKTGFQIPVNEWSEGRRGPRTGGRAMRSWALRIYRPLRPLRFLSLVTDAFGGHGGIALYNRDLLTSLCTMAECTEVVALPRQIPLSLEPLPSRLTYLKGAAGSKFRYMAALLRTLNTRGRFDAIVCSHINLLLPSLWAGWWNRAPVVLFIYGIDAWHPLSPTTHHALRYVDLVVSISNVTLNRFLSWSHLPRSSCALLPNAIHADWYGPGERNVDLVERYRLGGRKVIMTFGRLVSQERCKGFDEILDVLPDLAKELPDIVYVIAGSGSDKERLERKAGQLGIGDRVRFTGRVLEAEKADHYRLADAFVMPSSGEGFGFVLLEAMACGIPVVASKIDGGREAVVDGKLGILVDPHDREDLKRAIRTALARERGEVPAGLEEFAYSTFAARAANLMRRVLH